MPYLSKIYGAVSSTAARQAIIFARSAYVDTGSGPVQIYDGRPKVATGINGAYENGIVYINWYNNSKITNHFQLERKTGTGSWTVLDNFIDKSISEYEDEFETIGTHYYRVFAINDWGYVTNVQEATVIIESGGGGGTSITFDPADLTFSVGGATIIDVTVIINGGVGSWTVTSINQGASEYEWLSAYKLNDSTLRVSIGESQVEYGDSGWITIGSGSSSANFPVAYGIAN